MSLLSPPKITTMDEARRHRTYALGLMVLLYAFNFMDRRILSIVQTPIKEEFNLSDSQLGLLTGFLFAVVYTIFGIPLARVADSTNRKSVMVVSLAVWSGFTALSGSVTNYFQLALARMGVGIGEAGGSPPAHAIVSDLYEPRNRGRALAIYSSGLYLGTLMGNVGGGWISETFDWRTAFLVVGLPGVILAVVIHLTMREPLRGLSGLQLSNEKVTFLQSFKHLWSLKAFRYYSIATGAGTFVTYGLNDWMVPFNERVHGLSRTEIGILFGLVSGIAGVIGVVGGGFLADKLGQKDKRWYLWIPMWGKLIGGPIFILGLLSPDPYLGLACYGVGLVCASAYTGAVFAITHSLCPPGMRAMSSAVLLFVLNMLGIGLGPFLVGLFSDFLNDSAACQLHNAAVEMARACPRVEDVFAALKTGGFEVGRTLGAHDLSAALASGFQLDGLPEKAGLWGQMTHEFASMFPAVSGMKVGVDSLKWALIGCVAITYPLCILWHLGAQSLPKDPESKDAASGMAPAH